MPNFDTWLGQSHNGHSAPSAAQRAVDALRRINDRPSSIVLYRNETPLAAQTVRIEFDDSVLQKMDSPGVASEREIVVFGIKDHATVADTDIQVKDLFTLNNQDYEVRDVIELPGEVQAEAVRRT